MRSLLAIVGAILAVWMPLAAQRGPARATPSCGRRLPITT